MAAPKAAKESRRAPISSTDVPDPVLTGAAAAAAAAVGAPPSCFLDDDDDGTTVTGGGAGAGGGAVVVPQPFCNHKDVSNCVHVACNACNPCNASEVCNLR